MPGTTSTSSTPPPIPSSHVVAYAPSNKLSQEDLNKLYPNFLQLCLVQFIHRHGERSPVWPGLENVISPFHLDCHLGSVLGLGAADHGAVYRKSLVNAATWADGVPSDHLHKLANPNACYHGQLTDKGRSTLSDIGTSLRDLYVNQLKFLPTTFDKPGLIFLRSTDYPRTLESLHSLIGGLYPTPIASSLQPLFIYSRTPATYDTPYADNECKRYKTLRKQFSVVAREKILQEKASWPTKLQSMWDDKVGPFLAFDVIASAIAHNWKLDLTLPEFELLRSASTRFWYDHMDSDPIVPRLLIGRFMNELSELQEHVVSGKPSANLDFSMHTDHMVQTNTHDPPKFAVYSGHDTTIAPVLCALGLWAGKNRNWPYFASHITIETFKVAPGSSPVVAPGVHHYVRVKYNDVPQHLPACQKVGNHHPSDPSLCTYKAFKALIDEVATTRTDHNVLCRPKDP